LYRSLPLSIIAFIITAVGVIVFSSHARFELKTIMQQGHYFEMIAIALVFGAILLPNVIRMWWYVIQKPGIRPSFMAYLKGFSELIIQMFTQKRVLGCDDNQLRWFEHFILVIGYLALLFTTVFLDWFATGSLFVIALGYIESMIVFIVTFDFMIQRIKKNKEVSKFSLSSDWFFVIWLFLMGLTAFLVRLFIDTNLIETNSWIYLIHLTILAQWALIIVPFGKWTHFLYRSFAMYFEKIR